MVFSHPQIMLSPQAKKERNYHLVHTIILLSCVQPLKNTDVGSLFLSVLCAGWEDTVSPLEFRTGFQGGKGSLQHFVWSWYRDNQTRVGCLKDVREGWVSHLFSSINLFVHLQHQCPLLLRIWVELSWSLVKLCWLSRSLTVVCPIKHFTSI